MTRTVMTTTTTTGTTTTTKATLTRMSSRSIVNLSTSPVRVPQYACLSSSVTLMHSIARRIPPIWASTA